MVIRNIYDVLERLMDGKNCSSSVPIFLTHPISTPVAHIIRQSSKRKMPFSPFVLVQLDSGPVSCHARNCRVELRVLVCCEIRSFVLNVTECFPSFTEEVFI